MLQETRKRVFFREDPDRVQSTVEGFVTEEGGHREKGLPRMTLYSIRAPGEHDRRFLTIALRTPREPDSPLTGNLTLRYRDEPDGPFARRADDLGDALETAGVELIPPGRAHQLERSGDEPSPDR